MLASHTTGYMFLDATQEVVRKRPRWVNKTRESIKEGLADRWVEMIVEPLKEILENRLPRLALVQ